jgi:hypothetical protein
MREMDFFRKRLPVFMERVLVNVGISVEIVLRQDPDATVLLG